MAYIITEKNKGEFACVHAVKAYSSTYFKLSTWWKNGVSVIPWALYPCEFPILYILALKQTWM
jgi:hypothetical protein